MRIPGLYWFILGACVDSTANGRVDWFIMVGYALAALGFILHRQHGGTRG
ncbi:MAG TPA: hypothetical protein VL563_15115 [Gemmatimonadales bacterium]|jgi:hypothetical protein|nr:hypothetical protein [Gemmatimonadales bacterium]